MLAATVVAPGHAKIFLSSLPITNFPIRIAERLACGALVRQWAHRRPPAIGPFEGLRVVVVQFDEDVGLEGPDGGVNTSLDLLSGELSEAALEAKFG
jgi:hypothetical protein